MPLAHRKNDSTAEGQAGKPFERADQLGLQLFSRVASFHRAPPERALWRELVNLAIGTRQNFQDRGQLVSASVVVLVAYALYMRANPAGIIEGFSIQMIAADCRSAERQTKAALAVISDLRILRRTRPSRREPARYTMNIGGRDWPTVRRRVAQERASARQQKIHFDDLSGACGAPLSGACGAPLLRANTKNVRTEIKSDVVAASTREQQQRPRDDRRTEGLIAAIATRARQLDKPFDETATRAKFASGETTVQQLQLLADFLKLKLADQQRAADHAAVPCGRVRNCPKCDTDDRGTDDARCLACGWEEATDADRRR